jgi:hypothetical protein
MVRGFVISNAVVFPFLCIEGDGPDATVRISNPWFVGESFFAGVGLRTFYGVPAVCAACG